MGRHNGGTRSKGGNLAVGAALTNKQKGKIRPGAPKGSTEPTSHRHTTEAPASGLQSMLDATDLSELMDMVRGGGGDVFSFVFSSSFPKTMRERTLVEREKSQRGRARQRGRESLGSIRSLFLAAAAAASTSRSLPFLFPSLKKKTSRPRSPTETFPPRRHATPSSSDPRSSRTAARAPAGPRSPQRSATPPRPPPPRP